MPKNLYFFLCIYLFLSTETFFAQGVKGSGSNAISSIPAAVRNDTCLDKKFSVVVYIITDSNFVLTNPTTSLAAISTYSLSQCFSKLNATFSPWCISFEHCKTVIIPNYTYNEWNQLRNGINAIAEYNTENTICLYLPYNFVSTNMYDPLVNGYAYNPDTVAPYKNAIICTKGGALGSALYHGVGTFFGLPHTFAEINPSVQTTPPTPANIYSKEFVNKTNSLIHGDGFSDTEADPFPSTYGTNTPPNSNLDCGQVSIKDANGEYYTVPAENYMSHYLGCACRYSQQQYLAMVHHIMRKRMYLH